MAEFRRASSELRHSLTIPPEEPSEKERSKPEPEPERKAEEKRNADEPRDE
jgi:hypothetical protein